LPYALGPIGLLWSLRGDVGRGNLGHVGLIDRLRTFTVRAQVGDPFLSDSTWGKRVPTRNIIWALSCTNAIEAQAKIKGRAPRTWETAVTSDDTDVVVIDGCWPLPARGQ
jgi:hypothetical protein